MKAVNEFSMNMISRSSNESFARVAVAAFVAQLDPTIDQIADIKTAVSEAVTNAIVHAYPDKIGKIGIRVRIFANNQIEVQIKDWGVGIADIHKAMEPLFTTSPGGERSGLGFTVMQSFMDRVAVRSKIGKGTTVTLRKTLIHRPEHD